jgi:tetratricopeptide (TPR) repeat protein
MSDLTDLEPPPHQLQQQAADYLAAGKLDLAIATCQQILQLKPDYAPAFKIAADALAGQGKIDNAIQAYAKAIEFDPNLADAYANIAVLLHSQDKFEAAIPYYRRAIQLKPDRAETYYNLGIGMSRTGQLDQALACYQQVIRLQPNHEISYYICGTILHQQHKLPEAISYYRQAIKIKPNYAEPYCNLGVLLARQGNLTEAIACYQNAIAINPKIAEVYANLGAAYMAQGKVAAAIASYQAAIAINPNDEIAYSNLGNAYLEQAMLPEAIASCRQALLVKPDHADAHLNLGLALLLSGDLRSGFTEYEWRQSCAEVQRPHIPSSQLWDGINLEGKEILVYSEQGLGDTIQFIRYLSLVEARGGKVSFVCHPSLQRLFSNVGGIHQLLPEVTDLDIYAPLLSLPYILGTTLETIPSQAPYLSVPDGIQPPIILEIMQKQYDLKVGLVWTSNNPNPNSLKRSCPLSHFLKLVDIPKISFYGLQKDLIATDQDLLAQNQEKITDLSDRLEDFAATATIIEQLDLVISIDTAVAHLAGAMAKPIWVLLPFAPDWRWMLQRSDSPWYPTMRLFRQDSPNDWEGVVNKVYDALQSFQLGLY